MTGDSTADKLSLGGASKATGTWGSTSSTAAHQDNTYFAGTGKVSIAHGTAPTITTTITTNPTPTVVTLVTCAFPQVLDTSTNSCVTPVVEVVGGCSGGNQYNTSTGVLCVGAVAQVAIAGCGNRITGFSTTIGGKSCVGNVVSAAATSGTYNFGTVTLKNGSQGNAVMELQRFLNAKLALGLAVDGKLGPKTIAVIKQWQKDNGLVADGLVGAKTKAKMNAEVN